MYQLIKGFVIFFVILSLSQYVYAGLPLNVELTNVRGTRFTISWITENLEVGKIKCGSSIEDYNNWIIFNDDRGLIIDDIHHVTIDSIKPLTNYYYEIISGDTNDNNNGFFYSINSGPVLDPIGGSCQPAGIVYKDQKKTMLAFDSIVYVTIIGNNEKQNSAVESVLITTSTNGYWYLDLINFRTKDFQGYYSFECESSNILVKAQGGADGFSQITIPAVNYETQVSPDIILSTDSILPIAIVSGYPSTPTNLTEVNLNVSGLGVTDYKYKINDGNYSSDIPIANSIVISLTETEYMIAVIGKDSAGNWQSESEATTVTWTVDFTVPKAIITGVPSMPTHLTELHLYVEGVDIIGYKYKINNNSYSQEIKTDIPIIINITETEYTVSVVGKDSAGNWQLFSEETTLKCSFPSKNQYVISATADENGTITPSETIIVDSFDDKLFWIIPEKGYSIKNILVDNNPVGSVNVYTFTNITSNHTIHAIFSPIMYTITGIISYSGSQTGILYVEAYNSNNFEIIIDQKMYPWKVGRNESSYRLEIPKGSYHLRAYIDSTWAVEHQRDKWEAYGEYTSDEIIIDEANNQEVKDIVLVDPPHYQILLTTSEIFRGQPGRKFSFHINYSTSDLNTYLDGFGFFIHYNSNKIHFDNISNIYPGINILPSENIETEDISDGYPMTDRFVSMSWSDNGNNWPNKNLPLRLGTANFTINDQLEYGDTSIISFTSGYLHDGYQFYSYPITLKIASFNLDIDCNGKVKPLTDGLLIIRYLFGLTHGDTLIEGVVDTEKGTCITEEEIIENIKNLMPQ